jgi:hypothetical protein
MFSFFQISVLLYRPRSSLERYRFSLFLFYRISRLTIYSIYTIVQWFSTGVPRKKSDIKILKTQCILFLYICLSVQINHTCID